MSWLPDIFAQASSTSGGKVLSKNIDYHGRRAIVAQEAYRYYLTRLQADPAYRQQLRRSYWPGGSVNSPPVAPKYQAFVHRVDNTTPYRLRGDVRDKAMPVE